MLEIEILNEEMVIEIQRKKVRREIECIIEIDRSRMKIWSLKFIQKIYIYSKCVPYLEGIFKVEIENRKR